MNSSRRQFLAHTAAAGAAVVAAGSFTSPTLAAAVPAIGRDRITALTGVTVIDLRTGRRRRHQTVLIGGERIIAVGRRLPVPHGAAELDLAGKYVIPGLADLHVHTVADERVVPPLYLANGLTTVREMSGSPAAYALRDRIDAGQLLGARMIVGSQIIDGDPTLWDPNLLAVRVVGTEAEARAAVRAVKADGADFVKVYSRLSPAAYRAIIDEARRQGLTVHGHGPDQVPIEQVSAAGQRSVEHLHAVALGVSSRPAEIQRMLRSITLRTGDYNGWFRQFHAIEWLAANSYSRARAAALFRVLRRNRTRVTPTLTMHRVLDMPDHVRMAPEVAKYLGQGLASTYEWAVNNLYKANRTPEEIARQRDMWAYRQRFVRDLFAHEVPVLAGTDTGTPYGVPGFSLHEELELLVQAGATTRQALYSATVEPARFLGLGGDLGAVEPRKVADLVVLDADPLADIRNTRRIHTVITRGRVISPADRERMLAEVEKIAQQPPDPAAAPVAACCGGSARPSTALAG